MGIGALDPCNEGQHIRHGDICLHIMMPEHLLVSLYCMGSHSAVAYTSTLQWYHQNDLHTQKPLFGMKCKHLTPGWTGGLIPGSQRANLQNVRHICWLTGSYLTTPRPWWTPEEC